MRGWLVSLGLTLAGCGGGELVVSTEPAPTVVPTVAAQPAPRPEAAWYECQGSDQAFVRRAYQAVLGRRPSGQAEVNVWTDLLAAVDALDPARPRPPPHPLGADLSPGRRAVVEALALDLGYTPRWLDFYRDALRVQRLDVQANPGCYGTTLRGADPALVALVRDLPPEQADGDGGGRFSLFDLLGAALAADDLSPVYTANLFGMLARSYVGANADPVQRELARRGEFGAWFGASYLHRDGVCLGCHNSEASVTFSDDPATNRAWPLPGYFEKSLFGASTGPEPQGDHDSITRINAVLRFDGFSSNAAGLSPWGMAPACGVFTPQAQIAPDPASVDARFGPVSGLTASAWGLAASLQRGFAKLRQHGLSRGPAGSIPDPDEAFAYLVSASVAEQVWREVVGTPLTIANYFPRNAAARDQLLLLTEAFVSSGFSHKQLLRSILQSPAFNLLPPSAACGPSPYAMPPLFDPWTTGEAPALRGNGPGDGVSSWPSRPLLSATRAALGWSSLFDDAFHTSRESNEADFQAEIGVFLRNVEPGFVGFDMQSLLAWEAKTGPCTPPPGDPPDFIATLVADAQSQPDATVADAVLALKDRLLGDAALRSEAEIAALSALVGPLPAPASALGKGQGLRAVCGAMLSSSPFLLRGLDPPDGRAVPRLTPSSERYEAVCQRLAARGLRGGLRLVCEGEGLRVER